MYKFWRMMAEYNAESKTYSEAAGTKASPFVSDFNGKLLALRTIESGDAATTLTEMVQWKLSCNKFRPNVIECATNGHGLQTAPGGHSQPSDWVVDQPIQSGVGITIEARNLTADTPVGVLTSLWGLFEVSD